MNLNQEEFPDIDFGVIQVSVAYLGATPEESESGVCLRIEEALEIAEDIERLTTTAREGGCDATLQLTTGADLNRVLNDVKGKIDAVTTFPLETEKPIVRAFSSMGNVSNGFAMKWFPSWIFFVKAAMLATIKSGDGVKLQLEK